MQIFDLNGTWQMRKSSTDAMEQTYSAAIPGSVLRTLLDHGVIEDPYYRDNVDPTLELLRHDYEFSRSFSVNREFLNANKVDLVCDGLDTLAELYINGHQIAGTDNMHRTYMFDVKSLLREGENELRINFESAIEYAARREVENPVWATTTGPAPGFNQIRKAHYMFGWDWGPILPDSGIWRSIYLRSYEVGFVQDIYVTQKHDPGIVRLEIDVSSQLRSTVTDDLGIEVEVIGPNGEVVERKTCEAISETKVFMDIQKPALWWPNGYGAQPLYTVAAKLTHKDVVIHEKRQTLGLRTITWRVEPDAYGKSFEVVVNGEALFAMGANYIPQHNILSLCNRDRTEKLIQDCIDANFNMLRVWGGGFFENDYFYDLCNEKGILIWQDLLFACAAYEMSEAFETNIVLETIDNVKRLRHHASLAIWCGNNEMEWAWADWNIPSTDALLADYVKQFEVVLPRVVREHDPNTFYWLASPSSGGGFNNPNEPTEGDVHYWDVWHGTKPFTDYRKYNFRFCSEFGFQSLPSMKTIESFTLPEDRNMMSYVMEKHQNHFEANGKILNYLTQMFQYPSTLDGLVYLSQLVQADAIRYGVEFWRQNRGISMGSLYWQLNDCWPVSSWSSIDSFGRWKALHYYAKRFHAPVLLSAREEGTSVSLYLTNDSREEIQGTVTWELRDHRDGIVKSGQLTAVVPALSAICLKELDFAEELQTVWNKRTHYLSFAFLPNDGSEGEAASRGVVLFVRPKHFVFEDPRLEWTVQETDRAFIVEIKSSAFAKAVELILAESDSRTNDNYFDLSSDENRRIIFSKELISEKMDLTTFHSQLTVRSLFDIQ